VIGQYVEGFKIGLAGLAAHKTRSGLTMLGIIVGVAAVIAMTAIGNGAKEETRRQIEAFGATTIFVRATRIGQEQLASAKQGLSEGLAVSDGQYLTEAFSFVRAVAPEAILEQKATYRGREPKSQVVGVGPEFFDLTRVRVARGRTIAADDIEENRRVCVLGATLARELFLQEDALGKAVRVGSLRMTVIGTLKRSDSGGSTAGKAPDAGAAGGDGTPTLKDRDVDRDLYIPLPMALSSFWRMRTQSDSFADPTYHRIRELIVQVDRPESVRMAKTLIAKVLRRRHGKAEDFEVVAPLEILEQSQRTQDIFNLVMALIAGLSLVVGGIGIMNIMLATVTERTREIGVRRALGASREDILIQFLMEALVISVTGGLLGIALGVGISWLVHFALGWATLTTVWAIVLAFGVSAAVGILFGLFPAQKAAYMDPIAALRHE
jgi:putative ABC transport system permease protein